MSTTTDATRGPAVTPERFAQGMTYEQFKAAMTRNQERFTANEQRVALEPDDVATWKRLPQELKVVAIGEDWCGDVIDNLPILAKIAEASGKLDVRVFLRDQNLDIMDQYLKEGKFRSIPVFVFFDQQFNEIGRFIERPGSVTERRATLRQELFAQHPEFGAPGTPPDQLPEDVRRQMMQATATQREQLKPQENRDVIVALGAIAAKAGA